MACVLVVAAVDADDNTPRSKMWSWATPKNSAPYARGFNRGGKTAAGTRLDDSLPKADKSESANDANGDLSDSNEELPQVRLNYVSSDWKTVLNELAEVTGSTLVLMDEPDGRYSRRDYTKYTRADAVRILNRDLEPKGFRILEKEKFLTVINVHRERREYTRKERPLLDQPAAHTAAEVPQSGVMQAIGHSTDRLTSVQRAAHEAVQETEPAQPAGPEIVTEKVTPTNLSAVDLSRQVHQAFASRSELIPAGMSGLPAFRVHAPGAGDPSQSRVLFEIEINQQADEILVHAPAAMAARVAQLFQRLDVPPVNNDGQAVRFVAENEHTSEVAREIGPTLNRLAQFRQGAEGVGRATEGDAVPVPPAEAPDAPAASDATDSEKSLMTDVRDEIRGEVTITYVEGVGLVLIGNKRDIDAVARIIQSVEKLAVGSLPKIELHMLRDVDSESLAELLTTVYDNMATLKARNQPQAQAQNADQKQVFVVPVVTPNAVLILAAQPMMDAVKELIDKLDQPIDPEKEIAVYHLKFAVASQVLTSLQTFYDSRPGLGTAIRSFADIRTNTVVIQARPNDIKAVSALIEELDRDDSNAVLHVERIKLKYATADDLASFLSRAIQSVLNPPSQQTQQGGIGAFPAAVGGTTQAAQQLRDSKAVVLEFLSRGENSQQLIKSGLLTDVRITSEPRTNSLLLSAPEASFPLLQELINVLDTPSATVANIKVFPLKNADAVSTATLLQSLFTPNTQQQGNGQQGQQQGGLQVVDATDTSSALIPLVFQSDSRTNSVIAIGGASALTVAEAIISRLDNSDSKNRRREVIRLRNTPAADIANALTLYLQQIRDIAQIDPERITTNQLLEQEITVQAEPVSNNLLIAATPRYFDDIVRIVQQLDREPQQVMIQACLVQVSLTNDLEFGIELGFQDPLLFNRSVAGVPGFNFNNLGPLGNNTTAANPASVGTQGLSNFALGRTDSTLGFGGLVLAASSNSVSALLRALAATSDIQILSRPSILAVDNQIAEITQGQTVPRPQGVTVTGTGVVSPTIQDTPVGILLSVIPRITPEGQVIMVLVAQKSELSDQSVPIFADASSGNVVSSPIINATRAQTTIKVPDGQTIVVGGMITTNDTTVTRKVPWLGDLPVVGHAFRYDQFRNDRTELLIFLTPRILRTDCDAEDLKQIEAERLHFFESDVEEVQGPIYQLPTPRPYLGPNYQATLPTSPLPPIALPGLITPTPDHQAPTQGSSGLVTPGIPGVPGGQSAPIPNSGQVVPALPPGAMVLPPSQPNAPLPGTIPPETLLDTPRSNGGPVLHPWPIEPATNSRRVKSDYGQYYGRQPLPN
jgi:type II secretion system protein D